MIPRTNSIFSDTWYNDTVDIYRVEEYLDGSLSKKRRFLVKSGVKCRVFRSSSTQTNMTNTASEINNNDNLACDANVDIIAGDELRVTRGDTIGISYPVSVYFAGDPKQFYEPWAGIKPRLSHLEIPLGGKRVLSKEENEEELKKLGN